MNQKGLFKKRKPPLGSVPGSLNIDEKAPFPEIKLIEFDGNYLREEILENLEELKSIVFERGKVHWVDVQVGRRNANSKTWRHLFSSSSGS